MSKIIIFLIMILPFFLMISCSEKNEGSAAKANSSKKQALALAINNFPEKEYGNIENYSITIMDYSKTDEWVIFFKGIGKLEKPGGHCMINVSKKSGKIVFMPGQ